MYGTVEDWRTHATARGNNAPADAVDMDAEAALQRASDYIKYRYVAHLLPAYDETLELVELATYEAANIELATPGFFTKTYTPDDRKILTEVKGIKWTPVGSGKEKFGAQPVSTIIETMFEPYVKVPGERRVFMFTAGSPNG